VPIPQYSFVEHKRLDDPTYAHPANIILFEGLMAFHDPRIRDLMTYKVFITCDGKFAIIQMISDCAEESSETQLNEEERLRTF
jgi:uridine kinase